MISLKSELLRKTIHIASSLIPVIYYFTDRTLALSVLIPGFILLITVEILKYKNQKIRQLYFRFFGAVLRPHEFNTSKFRINGASWLLLGDIICIILFPAVIAIAGMLLLSLADSMSAIFGRLYGKKTYAVNRTYIGTIAFFITGFIIIILTPKYYYTVDEFILYFFMLILTTIADSINFPWDDNFTIPIVSCFSLYFLYLLFYPELNLLLFH